MARWVVDWDNGLSACGTFPAVFTTKRDAESYAREWKRSMVALERTPADRAEARRSYTWEVVHA